MNRKQIDVIDILDYLDNQNIRCLEALKKCIEARIVLKECRGEKDE